MPPARNQKRNLDDYITVAERIDKFYGKHPGGSLQTEIVFDDGIRIVMQARAYRTEDDARPGMGTAEEIRGKGHVNATNAVENCETSAWGRAIAALGFEVTKGIASREEMEQAEAERARQADSLPKLTTVDAETALAVKELFDQVVSMNLEERGTTKEFMEAFKQQAGELGISAGAKFSSLTPKQAADLSTWLEKQGGES